MQVKLKGLIALRGNAVIKRKPCQVMLQLGYEFGKGLGHHNQGIKTPIVIQLPKAEKGGLGYDPTYYAKN